MNQFNLNVNNIIDMDIAFAEIVTELKDLKTQKSPGLDNITNRVLKQFPRKALELLVIIYNFCLILGY